MRFTKMHGAGNDYVYVDGFAQTIDDPEILARRLSDRHFGVGGDGLVLILPPDHGDADVRMRMFNADGSEGKMCGNAIRCVAKYCWDYDVVKKNPLRVETASGVKPIELTIDKAGRMAFATVDMGEPILEPRAIPVNMPVQRIVDTPIRTRANAYQMTCVSMGNPHAVIYVADVDAIDLPAIGPELETHPVFPDRMNVHFVQVLSDNEVRMRTWERGSGITLACGTGASAVCVAGVLTGRGGREILAHLPGGDLKLLWRQENNHVYMTGPAVEVFRGEWLGEGAIPAAEPDASRRRRR